MSTAERDLKRFQLTEEPPLGGAFVEMEPVREFRARVTTTTAIITGEIGEMSAWKRIMFVGTPDCDDSGDNATVLEYADGSVRIIPDDSALYELPAEQRVR